MRATIKNVYSPDVDDIYNYQPNDLNNFYVFIRAIIGPENEEGEESFDFEVCSPEWLSGNCSDKGAVFGRHLIITNEYNLKTIIKMIENYLENIDEKKWNEIALKIARIGKWEFEDYLP